MFGETNTSFLNGGTALSFVAYGLFSAFITGPEILHRESIKQGWPQKCNQIVIAELKQKQSEEQFVPQINYRDMARGWFGKDADPLLELIAPLGQMMDQANAQKERVKRLNEERLQQKVNAAGSRCACAVTMLSEHCVSLGLYAGTGRLVTPSLFRDLGSSLHTSLQSSHCDQRG
jgi:hypothetical protein